MTAILSPSRPLSVTRSPFLPPAVSVTLPDDVSNARPVHLPRPRAFARGVLARRLSLARRATYGRAPLSALSLPVPAAALG